MSTKPWDEDHDKDDEGGMALNIFSRIEEMIDVLQELVEEKDKLPPWVQYKITTALNSISDVYGYMYGESEKNSTSFNESEDNLQEKKKKGLWANMWARRKAGKRPLRPGEKGYPKTLDIENVEDENSLDDLREVIKHIVEKDCKGYKKSPVGSPRQRSFCKRMCGMKKKNTGSETASDPDSCINQSLRRWKCRCR